MVCLERGSWLVQRLSMMYRCGTPGGATGQGCDLDSVFAPSKQESTALVMHILTPGMDKGRKGIWILSSALHPSANQRKYD